MSGDVISNHFLMLWFQKYFQDTVGFRTFKTFPKFYQLFLTPSPILTSSKPALLGDNIMSSDFMTP